MAAENALEPDEINTGFERSVNPRNLMRLAPPEGV
jgi:hypothetical protein